MIEFILIAIIVFVAISLIAKSKNVFIRSIPYVLYIYLFLLFFEDSVFLIKVIIFAVLLSFSVLLILYKDVAQENA